MDDLTRRAAAQRLAALGLLPAFGPLGADARADDPPFDPAEERRRVMAVGMTEAEALMPGLTRGSVWSSVSVAS